jgi:hypothetical protein
LFQDEPKSQFPSYGSGLCQSDVSAGRSSGHFDRYVLWPCINKFSQISGINIITYYAATIFEQNIGLSGFLSRLLAACNGTEYWFASFIAIFVIERIGRRKLMIFGAAGQAFSMAVLAGTTSRVSSGLGITAVCKHTSVP